MFKPVMKLSGFIYFVIFAACFTTDYTDYYRGNEMKNSV